MASYRRRAGSHSVRRMHRSGRIRRHRPQSGFAPETDDARRKDRTDVTVLLQLGRYGSHHARRLPGIPPQRHGRFDPERVYRGGNPPAAKRGARTFAAENTGVVRLRRCTRLLHDLPHSARRKLHVGPGTDAPERGHRGRGGSRRRHQLDVRPDGGHHARSPLGARNGGCGRGPLPGIADRPGARRRVSGRRPRQYQNRVGLHEAFRGVRSRRGGPRL